VADVKAPKGACEAPKAPGITPITKVLVSNRGEIARRIMRTARDMGIATVTVYADGDSEAPFVREADIAIALRGRTSAETYLNVDKIIDACRRSGADAVHPGYGFLSENAAFARAVIGAGLRWIGPSPDVIAQMGDKLSAKRLMQAAGVPTLPAIALTPTTNLAAAAREIGYPVLVKASAGGGGRGMRIVETQDQLADAVASARREAGSSFGDDTVFLEKWLTHARHVEIQILGDQHGNVVHCFERECSIQRRHQKIIEEAPSSAVTQPVRQRMCEAALAVARKLGYTSAGTVEFLLAGDAFWFLEVNARLQVEHPVTEAIIGADLVREQIRVAEGERLSFTQAELVIDGHAIEARLYAEDPHNGFLPSPGKVIAWAPSTVGGARFDAGIESGATIGTEFDAMIAKVIVHAPTRREAAARLARVLETTRIQGLTTNRDFLVATLRTPAFVAGDTTTDFIERVQPQRARAVPRAEFIDAAVVVAIESQARRRAAATAVSSLPSGWRNSTMPMQRLAFAIAAESGASGDDIVRVEYGARRDRRFDVVAATTPSTEATEPMLVDVYACGDGKVDIAIDGRRIACAVDRDGERWFVQTHTGAVVLTEQPRYPITGADQQTGGLRAPMPGVVLKAEVRAGDTVVKGQLLLILEAMKMEHRITAPRDGVVEALHVALGDQVVNGALLVTIGGGTATGDRGGRH
jgi:propionyl-CoA carboxylase alpha chain